MLPRRRRRDDMSFGEFCCGLCLKHAPFHIGIGLITFGINIFILWLSRRPKLVKFYVTDASLTEFDYENNTLHYDLALNFSFHNPNTKVGVDYEYIEAQTLFQDARCDLETLAPFYQGYKNTTVLSHMFKGQQLLALSADQASELYKEKRKGVYGIQVKLFLKTSFKGGGFKEVLNENTVTCDLQVPLTSSTNRTSSVGAFQTTECEGDLCVYDILEHIHHRH